MEMEREFTSLKRVHLSSSSLKLGELEEMFSDFAIDQLVIDRRLLVNRQNLKKMYSVWFQEYFRKLKDREKKVDIRNERGLRDVEEALE